MKLFFTWLGFMGFMMVIHIMMTLCGRFGDLGQYGILGYDYNCGLSWLYFWTMELPGFLLLILANRRPSKTALIGAIFYQLVFILSVLYPMPLTYLEQAKVACIWLIPLNIGVCLSIYFSPKNSPGEAVPI